MENTERKKINSLNYTFVDNDFTPDDVAKGLLLFLVFNTAVSLVYQLLFYIGLTSTVVGYVFNILLDVCFVLTVYFVAKNKRINTVKQLKVTKSPSLLMAIICILVSIVCIVGFSGVTNCFLEILYRMGYSSVSGDIVINTWGKYILYTICICVIPAICEEILFRGLVFTGLKKISQTVGIFGSAFIFMIMHGSPDQTVHQFILGVVLALAFLISNNLWVSIIIHFFNNFLAVTASFITYKLSTGANGAIDENGVNIYFSQYFIFAIISACIAVAMIYLLFKGLSYLCNKKANATTTVDNGTIDSEIDSAILKSEDFSVEISDINGANRQQIHISPKDERNKLSRQGKFLMIISIVWLALEWFIALFSGFIST